MFAKAISRETPRSGKQNILFSKRPVNKGFVYNSQIKNRKKTEKSICLMPAGTTNLLWFQGGQPDHVQIGSSNCCFPRELVNSVCPRELVSFDTFSSNQNLHLSWEV